MVSSFDHTVPQKQKRAQALVDRALNLGRGVISFQVIQEFLNVATKKFSKPFLVEGLQKYLEHVLVPLCEIHSGIELYQEAINIHVKFHYSFYDSLIITAALLTNCQILYSEDLQNNQTINGLIIKNPFH